MSGYFISSLASVLSLAQSSLGQFLEVRTVDLEDLDAREERKARSIDFG